MPLQTSFLSNYLQSKVSCRSHKSLLIKSLSTVSPTSDLMAPPKDFLVTDLAKSLDTMQFRLSNIRNLEPKSRCHFRKMSFNNCAFHDVDFSDCVLENCKLVACSIDRSTLSFSSADRCKLSKNVQADSCIFDACKVSDCKISRCYIKYSIIDLPRTIDSHLAGCTLSAGTFQLSWSRTPSANNDRKVQVFNCNIWNSEVSNVVIHANNKWSNTSTNRCVTIQSPLAFRKFPPELRETIFRQAILEYIGLFDGYRTTTPLIAALRGDPALYLEAVGVLRRDVLVPLDCLYRGPSIPLTISSMASNTIRRLFIT